MIVIDIGNTNTVLGIFLNKKLLKKSRITSTNIKNFEKNLTIFFNSNFKLLKKSKTKICLLSSVVPRLNNLVKKITLKYDIIFFNLNSKNLPFKLNIKYDLKKIGADRLANTIAIINLKYKNSIIVDFGTATTFDVIKNNTYVGGLIFPGISISHNSLIKSAALLKKIKFVKIKKIVANSTNESMQAGFYWGYISVVNGIIEKIIDEKKFKPKIILTGGLANIFKSRIKPKPIVNENLTLEGLRIIGKKINA